MSHVSLLVAYGIFALLSIAITYVITQSMLFGPVRMWVRARDATGWVTTLVYCASCTGFWVGLGLCFAAQYPGVLWHAPLVSLAVNYLVSAYTGNPMYELEAPAPAPEPHDVQS